MPPVFPKAFDSAVSRSGFSISVAVAKAGQYVRIGISEQAQAEHFGRTLDPAKDAIKLTMSDDQRDNHVMKVEVAKLDDPAAITIFGGARSSLHIKLSPWTQIATGKRPTTELPVIAQARGAEVLLKLPEWARPEIRKIGQGKSIMEV
ncbi:MAG: hypothetical protein GYB53_21405 [Rhodobacteraceae bacterium]|nr:hypothetical protein [Paracoccaceae bacterium]MBR9823056.1 hypothetical protein [Paracoccaceae bacterium]